VFPGDLLLKNFGVTSHGRVIFYDYDEIGLVTDCVFRDLPQPTSLEEEMSAEPWFHCGPRDVFPEQWLPFLSIPPALEATFKEHHAELLTAAWWRDLSRDLSGGPSSGAGVAVVTPLRAVPTPIGACV
jgi:isocitrate dehydrogenase kinase/phosphatase